MDNNARVTIVSEPKSDKPHISPSQISSYLRCPEAYRRRYVKGEKLPPAIAAVKGVSVHKSAEHDFRQKIQSRQDLQKEEILEVASATFDEKIKHEGVMLQPEEEARGKTIVMGEAKDSTVRMAELFIVGGKTTPAIAPKYQPVEVELKQKIVLENSSHDLLGIVDMIDENKKIIDLKTTSRTMNQDTVDRMDQLTFYSLLYRAKNGVDPTGIVIENMVDLKQPKVETIETSRSMEDYNPMINRINAIVDAINKGVFPPTDPTNWVCSRKFCGFFPSCDYVKK